MKKVILLSAMAIFGITILGSCSSHHAISINSGKKVPPGQMKKMTGSKSAKDYAPGQQKKKHKH
ncbi:hypothetical protein SAMN04487906_1720 [Zhouia amylolytica]|uniref:Quinol oxidase subunit 4 n=2 Tax=Zhouia amylolytica TaxID=376730 RepID=W2UKL1_9FLAO|nr:hypothetical protein [Zhouia amylolytica]ETN94538.1 quinol oxidase subunit 4 [Zhouia amylolytica AD3]MCQ0111541.1 hypothetical protein [Zhouia amylolytica]SFS78672.1 hypothetical protein SAMN04487906_1720 [Zhouia amylolytica]